ncbi:hypothetical protein MMC21_001022 [Puttea exsequens]|nr:hypothetical protein [Puttea exsequens]
MVPATEFATLPLAVGAEVEDLSSEAGKVWHSSLDTVSQQDGFQRLYWGREVENDNVLNLFIDWDSYEHHQKFIASPEYAPFGKHLKTIVDGNIIMRHVNFSPHPPSAAVSNTSSPVTEIVTCYFEAYDEGYADKIDRLFQAFEKAPGFKTAASGWVIEDIEHEKIGSGKKDPLSRRMVLFLKYFKSVR